MSEATLRELALQVRKWGSGGRTMQLVRLITSRLTRLQPLRNWCQRARYLPWMHAKEIAAIGSDTYAVEVRPSELGPFRSPFHCCAIPNMGLTLGKIFYLEELAADCAEVGRYTFLLVAPPLPVSNAVGTPINPYAMR